MIQERHQVMAQRLIFPACLGRIQMQRHWLNVHAKGIEHRGNPRWQQALNAKNQNGVIPLWRHLRFL
jgi:hypothetical protein